MASKTSTRMFGFFESCEAGLDNTEVDPASRSEEDRAADALRKSRRVSTVMF
jgi:hypothetical protein